MRRARAEARAFLEQARALAAQSAGRLAPATRSALESAMARLQTALAGEDLEALGGASASAQGLLEEHLGFARRSPAAEYAASVAKAVAVALFLRLFVIEAYQIPSGSMIPALLVGDHIFVNKLSYGVRLPAIHWQPLRWGEYRRGEVVVFAHPLDDDQPLLDRRDFIKRIVGLPGDVVEVKGEVVHIDGRPQPRWKVRERVRTFDRAGDSGPWVGALSELWEERLENAGGRAIDHPVLRDENRIHFPYEGPFRVPQGHLFVMGDNRDNSQDGRAGGWFVPFDHVKGRALFVWWSWGKPGTWSSGEPGVRMERLFTAVR